jgi:twitching motility protein PilT
MYATDLFIVSGLPLTFKKGGKQIRGTEKTLMPEDTIKYIKEIYAISDKSFDSFDKDKKDDDFSFSIPDVGRFRANVFMQRGSLATVVRIIQFGLPMAEDINIPEEVLAFADEKNGLVLLTGPAMRSVFRESADVILLGELRDLNTMEVAMTAAETGQLIFSTLHTIGAANSIDRVIDSFPASQQGQIRLQLSMMLRGVISQQLVPTIDGKIIPVFEIMKTNVAIRNLIRDAKTHQITSTMIASNDMTTMDANLVELKAQGIITEETALAYSQNKEWTRKKLIGKKNV